MPDLTFISSSPLYGPIFCCSLSPQGHIVVRVMLRDHVLDQRVPLTSDHQQIDIDLPKARAPRRPAACPPARALHC